MEKLFSLAITVIMTFFVFRGYRKSGILRSLVAGSCFFAFAFYLDLVCALMIEGFSAGRVGGSLLSWLAVAVSKGILIAILLTGYALFVEFKDEIDVAGQLRYGGNVAAGTGAYGSRAETDSFGMPDGAEVRGERGWSNYMTGLTLGVNLFFLLLGLEVERQQGSVMSRFLKALCLFTVLLLFYCSQIIYEKRAQRERKQEKILNGKREADVYLENVENNYQRTRELWHDLKNHIHLLHVLLSEKKYEQMEDYLRVFGEDVDLLTLPVKSGNLIVDALLEDKVARAKKEGVRVSLSLCNLTGLTLKPDEICGLFGNLLDNSLEANRQVREGRFIAVDCREQEEAYYIQVRNPTAGKVREQDGIRQTEKSDRLNRVGHGLGLRSVERAVHGCGGELAVDSGEREFTVVVKLPRSDI